MNDNSPAKPSEGSSEFNGGLNIPSKILPLKPRDYHTVFVIRAHLVEELIETRNQWATGDAKPIVQKRFHFKKLSLVQLFFFAQLGASESRERALAERRRTGSDALLWWIISEFPEGSCPGGSSQIIGSLSHQPQEASHDKCRRQDVFPLFPPGGWHGGATSRSQIPWSMHVQSPIDPYKRARTLGRAVQAGLEIPLFNGHACFTCVRAVVWDQWAMQEQDDNIGLVQTGQSSILMPLHDLQGPCPGWPPLHNPPLS